MKPSAALLALVAHACRAADANAWKSRNIYFALTDRIARSSSDSGGSACRNLGDYCGGTFQGLQGKLDYIRNMGFDAIWITPVVANTEGGYHGYWAQDLYAVNSKYGSAGDLKNLVNAAHQKNMYVMVDVVANHVGPGPASDKRPEPLNKDSSYHSPCQIDYNNQTSIENCRIANLPDVNTQDSSIRSVYQNWVKWLVHEYKFDGIRIDTVKHVEKEFWPGFTSAAGVYSIGEVLSRNATYVSGYAGPMALLNYPIYYPMNNFYQQKGSSQDLVDMHNTIGTVFPDPAALGTFLDNHDNARFLNQNNDASLLKNALTYVILARGVPIVYYGTEQGYAGGDDPGNREDLWRSSFNANSDIYQFLAKVSGVRRAAGGLPANDHTHLLVEATGYAWGRANGKVIALTSNIGKGKSQKYCIETKRASGSWKGAFDGKTYTANGNGQLCATVENGEPLVFVG
ncbi:hypothetical protein QQS21_006049 [Conoideocrella luteorostrata]|uniref:Glycosyl hydrolase family 13 catalytic domain-containing protein n=1 Tax=Conoideocrella luteorostrata TaxID=1105319 RepID=A0AAJ0CSJ9_9HYPO|nr:hypothetical protein QQS21_006049 [Conoideocrella luteorostrata]